MIAAERHNQIIKRLRANKVVSVNELAKEFKTTEMTIRRDLAFLEKQGLLKRAYGGAVINEKVGMESDFAIRQAEDSGIKELIGKKAASLITSGDCIGIDIGTTSLEIAKNIKHIPDLNVITASIPVINELMNTKNIKVICTGGEFSHKDMSLTGHNAIRTIQEYTLDKMFVGVAGISFEYGYTLFNMHDALVKREFIKRSREVIIVAQSSKIGVTRHAFLCDIDVASKIITDSGISKEDYDNFVNHGVEVIIADKEELQ